MNETFVTLRINGIDTDYVISDTGRVLTKNGGKEKCTELNRDGYVKVSIQINKKPKLISVHRAVYESFVGEIPKGMQINHIDGNKLNNSLDNLEVVTPSENVRHAWLNGLCKKQDRKGSKNPNYRSRTGEDNPTAIHTKEEAISVYALLKDTKLSHRQIASMLDLDVQFVDNISKGLWAEITGYDRDEIRRNHKFTDEEELIIWYLYSVEGYRTNELVDVTGINKDSINNKLTYLRRNKAKKMNKKIQKPEVKELVDNFLCKTLIDDCYSINDEEIEHEDDNSNDSGMMVVQFRYWHKD